MNPLLSLMQTFFGGGSVPDQPKAPRSSGKSSLDSLNELARLDQTSRHKRVDANGNNLVGQPTGLDYLDMYGPDRESVKLRTQALNAQVQDPNIVARGKAAVEARKREQADMLPQYGLTEDVGGGIRAAMRDGQVVGYSKSKDSNYQGLPIYKDKIDRQLGMKIGMTADEAAMSRQDMQNAVKWGAQNDYDGTMQGAINYGYLNSDLPTEVGQIDTALLNGGRGARLPVETPTSPMGKLPLEANPTVGPSAPASSEADTLPLPQLDRKDFLRQQAKLDRQASAPTAFLDKNAGQIFDDVWGFVKDFGRNVGDFYGIYREAETNPYAKKTTISLGQPTSKAQPARRETQPTMLPEYKPGAVNEIPLPGVPYNASQPPPPKPPDIRSIPPESNEFLSEAVLAYPGMEPEAARLLLAKQLGIPLADPRLVGQTRKQYVPAIPPVNLGSFDFLPLNLPLYPP